MQTPTKQQGSPQNPGKSTPKRRKRGKKGDAGSRPGKGKTKQGRGTKAHPGSAQAAPIFLAWYRSRPVLCPGGGYQRPRQLSPPGVRCASVPDDHAALFVMSSMRLSAAASGFRRTSSQMAFETWPVWVVWLNLNRGTFWSTTETSRNGAEGSTRR